MYLNPGLNVGLGRGMPTLGCARCEQVAVRDREWVELVAAGYSEEQAQGQVDQWQVCQDVSGKLYGLFDPSHELHNRFVAGLIVDYGAPRFAVVRCCCAEEDVLQEISEILRPLWSRYRGDEPISTRHVPLSLQDKTGVELIRQSVDIVLGEREADEVSGKFEQLYRLCYRPSYAYLRLLRKGMRLAVAMILGPDPSLTQILGSHVDWFDVGPGIAAYVDSWSGKIKYEPGPGDLNFYDFLMSRQKKNEDSASATSVPDLQDDCDVVVDGMGSESDLEFSGPQELYASVPSEDGRASLAKQPGYCYVAMLSVKSYQTVALSLGSYPSLVEVLAISVQCLQENAVLLHTSVSWSGDGMMHLEVMDEKQDLCLPAVLPYEVFIYCALGTIGFLAKMQQGMGLVKALPIAVEIIGPSTDPSIVVERDGDSHDSGTVRECVVGGERTGVLVPAQLGGAVLPDYGQFRSGSNGGSFRPGDDCLCVQAVATAGDDFTMFAGAGGHVALPADDAKIAVVREGSFTLHVKGRGLVYFPVDVLVTLNGVELGGPGLRVVAAVSDGLHGQAFYGDGRRDMRRVVQLGFLQAKDGVDRWLSSVLDPRSTDARFVTAAASLAVLRWPKSVRRSFQGDVQMHHRTGEWLNISDPCDWLGVEELALRLVEHGPTVDLGHSTDWIAYGNAKTDSDTVSLNSCVRLKERNAVAAVRGSVRAFAGGGDDPVNSFFSIHKFVQGDTYVLDGGGPSGSDGEYSSEFHDVQVHSEVFLRGLHDMEPEEVVEQSGFGYTLLYRPNYRLAAAVEHGRCPKMEHLLRDEFYKFQDHLFDYLALLVTKDGDLHLRYDPSGRVAHTWEVLMMSRFPRGPDTLGGAVQRLQAEYNKTGLFSVHESARFDY